MSSEPSELPPDVQRLLSLDAEDGPARPLSGAEQDALIGNVLDAWGGAPTVMRRPRHTMRLLLAATLALLAGSAAAYFTAVGAPWAKQAPEAEKAGATAAVQAHGPRAEPAPGEPVEPTLQPASEPAPAQRARDLLAQANELRAAARYGEAAEVYLQAAARAPNAQLAQVAQVAAGDLHLERLRRPERALELYRAALAGGGPLSPEAQAGMARALRALGDREGEREALEDLRETHPDSPGAGWAHERLEVLER